MAKVYQMPAKQPRPPAAHHRGRLIGIGVGVLALAFVVFVIYLLAYTDWLWFGEVGLRVVFWRQIWSRLVVGVAAGAIFFVIFYANIEIARRLSPRHRAFEGIDVVEYVNERTVQGLRRGGLIGALVIAIFVGAGSSADWLVFQRALNGVPFGSSDPIFHHDIGFYVFTLPAWQAVYGLVMGALIAGLVAAVIIHAAMGGLVLTQQRPAPTAEQPEPAARGPFGRPGGPFARGPGQANVSFVIRPRSQSIAHLSVVLGIIFALAGTGYIFKAWNLLFASDGVVAGAGYTDIHAGLPGMRFMMIFGWALGALLIANAFWRRRWRWPLYGIGGWVVALIVVRVVFPAVMQSLIVSPNQQGKEGPYIAYNITATRAAYGLDRISQTQYPLTGDLSTAKLVLNSGTVGNIRLWDQSTLLTSYAQLQQLRPYYQFTTVSIDRYDINGTYRETMLAPRELNIAGLPSQSWVNQHVIYTHGFGAVVSAVNQVASDGSPDFLVQDVPPTSQRPRRHDHPAAHLLRPAGHQLHARQDHDRRVRLSRRAQLPLHRQRRYPHRLVLQQARLLGALRHHPLLHQHRDRQSEPHHHPQQHRGAPACGRAVPDPRPGPLHGDRGRQALLDRRRLHDDQPLPLLPARRQHQLHP